MSDTEQLKQLTAEIAADYVTNNPVAVGEISDLIVHRVRPRHRHCRTSFLSADRFARVRPALDLLVKTSSPRPRVSDAVRRKKAQAHLHNIRVADEPTTIFPDALTT